MSIRIVWVSFNSLSIKVLMGYELNKSLAEAQIEWSILDTAFFDYLLRLCGHRHKKIDSGYKVEEESDLSKKYAKYKALLKSNGLEKEVADINAIILSLKADIAIIENVRMGTGLASDSELSSTSQMQTTPN